MSSFKEKLSHDFDVFKKHIMKEIDGKLSKNIKNVDGDLKYNLNFEKMDIDKLKEFTNKMSEKENIKLFLYVVDKCKLFLRYDKNSGNFIYIYDKEYRADKDNIGNYIISIIDRCYRYTISQSIEFLTENIDKYTTLQNYIDKHITTAKYKKNCLDLLKNEM